MAQGIIIDVGFVADVKGFAQQIQQDFEKIDFGSILGLSDAFDRQAEDVRNQLKKLRDEIDEAIGGKIEGNPNKQLTELTNSVFELRKNVLELMQQAPRTAASKGVVGQVSAVTKSVQELGDACKTAAKLAEDIPEITLGNSSQEDIKDTVKLLKEAISDKEKLDTIKKKEDQTQYKKADQNTLIPLLKDQIALFEKLKREREALNENDIVHYSKNLAKIVKSGVEISRLFATLKDIGLYTKDFKGFGIDDNYIDSIITEADEQSERLEAKLNSINNLSQKNKANDLDNKDTKKSLADQKKSDENTYTVYISLDSKAYSKLQEQVITTIRRVQEYVDGQKKKIDVEIGVKVTKRFNKEQQEQIAQISKGISQIEDEQLKKTLNDLIMKTDSDFSVYVNVENANNQVSKFVKDAKAKIDELREQIQFNWNFGITENEKNELKKEIASIDEVSDAIQRANDEIGIKINAAQEDAKVTKEVALDEQASLKIVYNSFSEISDKINEVATRFQALGETVKIKFNVDQKGLEGVEKLASSEAITKIADAKQAIRDLIVYETGSFVEIPPEQKDKLMNDLNDIAIQVNSLFKTGAISNWEAEFIGALRNISGSFDSLFGERNNPLAEVLDDYEASDVIMKHQGITVNERSFVIGNDKNIYGRGTYDSPSTNGLADKIVDALPEGVSPYVMAHTHGTDLIAASSIGRNNNGGSDLYHNFNEFKNKGIGKSLTIAQKDVELWDSEGFFNSNSDIDFLDKDIQKKIDDTTKAYFPKLSGYVFKNIEELLDKYGTGITSLWDGVSISSKDLGIAKSLMKGTDEKSFQSDVINGLKNATSKDSAVNIFKGIVEKTLNPKTSDQKNVVGRLINSINFESIRKIIGIDNLGDKDLSAFGYRKMTPDILRDALKGTNYKDNYSQFVTSMTKDEFIEKDPYGLGSNGASSTLGGSLGAFDKVSESLNTICDRLQDIADQLTGKNPKIREAEAKIKELEARYEAEDKAIEELIQKTKNKNATKVTSGRVEPMSEEVSGKITFSDEEPANETKQSNNESSFITFFEDGKKYVYDVNTQLDVIMSKLREYADLFTNPVAHAGELDFQLDPVSLYRSDSAFNSLIGSCPGLISGLYASSNFNEVLNHYQHNGDLRDPDLSKNNRHIYAFDLSQIKNLLKFRNVDDETGFTDTENSLNELLKDGLKNGNIDSSKIEVFYKENRDWFESFNLTIENIQDFVKNELKYLQSFNLNDVEKDFVNKETVSFKDFNSVNNKGFHSSLRSLSDPMNRLLEYIFNTKDVGLDLTSILQDALTNVGTAIIPSLDSLDGFIDFGNNQEIFKEFSKMVFSKIVSNITDFDSLSYFETSDFNEIANQLLDQLGFDNLFKDEKELYEKCRQAILDKLNKISIEIPDVKKDNPELFDNVKDVDRNSDILIQQVEYALSGTLKDISRIPEFVNTLLKDGIFNLGYEGFDSDGNLLYDKDVYNKIQKILSEVMLNYEGRIQGSLSDNWESGRLVGTPIEKGARKTQSFTSKNSNVFGFSRGVQTVRDGEPKETVKIVDSKKTDNEQSFIFDKIVNGVVSTKEDLLKLKGELNNVRSLSGGEKHDESSFTSDEITVIGRESEYEGKIDDLIPRLKQAEELGANVGTIIGKIRDEESGLVYEIQKTQSGNTISYDNTEYLEATDEQIQKLISDLLILEKVGLKVDVFGDNILYDKDSGFSFIDLATRNGDYNVSPTKVIEEYFSYIMEDYEDRYHEMFDKHLPFLANTNQNNISSPTFTTDNYDDVWDDWGDWDATEQPKEETPKPSSSLLSRMSGIPTRRLRMLPSKYIQGAVRSVEDISSELKEDGVPESEIEAKAQEIRNAEIDAISELKEGFVRVIHRTDVSNIDSIIKNGLQVGNYGIDGTSTIEQSNAGEKLDKNHDYGSHWGHGSFVVADIPIEYYRMFEERGLVGDSDIADDDLVQQKDLELEILDISKQIDETYDSDDGLEKRIALLSELLELAIKYNSLVGTGGKSFDNLLHGDIHGGESHQFDYNSVDKIKALLSSVSDRNNLSSVLVGSGQEDIPSGRIDVDDVLNSESYSEEDSDEEDQVNTSPISTATEPTKSTPTIQKETEKVEQAGITIESILEKAAALSDHINKYGKGNFEILSKASSIAAKNSSPQNGNANNYLFKDNIAGIFEGIDKNYNATQRTQIISGMTKRGILKPTKNKKGYWLNTDADFNSLTQERNSLVGAIVQYLRDNGVTDDSELNKMMGQVHIFDPGSIRALLTGEQYKTSQQESASQKEDSSTPSQYDKDWLELKQRIQHDFKDIDEAKATARSSENVRLGRQLVEFENKYGKGKPIDINKLVAATGIDPSFYQSVIGTYKVSGGKYTAQQEVKPSSAPEQPSIKESPVQENSSSVQPTPEKAQDSEVSKVVSEELKDIRSQVLEVLNDDSNSETIANILGADVGKVDSLVIDFFTRGFSNEQITDELMGLYSDHPIVSTPKKNLITLGSDKKEDAPVDNSVVSQRKFGFSDAREKLEEIWDLREEIDSLDQEIDKEVIKEKRILLNTKIKELGDYYNTSLDSTKIPSNIGTKKKDLDDLAKQVVGFKAHDTKYTVSQELRDLFYKQNNETEKDTGLVPLFKEFMGDKYHTSQSKSIANEFMVLFDKFMQSGKREDLAAAENVVLNRTYTSLFGNQKMNLGMEHGIGNIIETLINQARSEFGENALSISKTTQELEAPREAKTRDQLVEDFYKIILDIMKPNTVPSDKSKVIKTKTKTDKINSLKNLTHIKYDKNYDKGEGKKRGKSIYTRIEEATTPEQAADLARELADRVTAQKTSSKNSSKASDDAVLSQQFQMVNELISDYFSRISSYNTNKVLTPAAKDAAKSKFNSSYVGEMVAKYSSKLPGKSSEADALLGEFRTKLIELSQDKSRTGYENVVKILDTLNSYDSNGNINRLMSILELMRGGGLDREGTVLGANAIIKEASRIKELKNPAPNHYWDQPTEVTEEVSTDDLESLSEENQELNEHLQNRKKIKEELEELRNIVNEGKEEENKAPFISGYGVGNVGTGNVGVGNIIVGNGYIPQSVPSQMVYSEGEVSLDEEAETFNPLNDAIEDIIESLKTKNQLIVEEADIVSKKVPGEVDDFGTVQQKIEEINDSIGDKNGKLQSLFGDGTIVQPGAAKALTDSLVDLQNFVIALSDDKSATNVEKLASNLQRIAEALKTLDFDNSGVLSQVQDLIKNPAGLKDLAEILKTDAQKLSTVQKKRDEEIRKTENLKISSDYLKSNEKSINDNFDAEMKKKNAKVISKRAYASDDGNVVIEALVNEKDKDNNDQYKKYKYKTSKDNPQFVLDSVDESPRRILGEIKARQSMMDYLNNLVVTSGQPVQITKIGSEKWDELVQKAHEFGIELENVDAIEKKIDGDRESFKFTDKQGNVQYFGLGSDGILLQNQKLVKSIDELTSEYVKDVNSIKGAFNKAIKTGDQQDILNFVELLEKVRDEYQDLQDLSDDGFSVDTTKLDEKSNAITTDLQNLSIFTTIEKPKDPNVKYNSKTMTLYSELKSIMESLAQGSISDILGGKATPEEYSKFLSDIISKVRILTKLATTNQGKLANKTKAQNFLSEIADEFVKAPKMSNEHSIELNSYKDELSSYVNDLSELDPDRLNEIAQGILRIKTEITENGEEGKTFLQRIGQDIRSQTEQFIARYLSLQDMINYLRQGWQYALQYNTALTKISYTMDLTDTQLKEMGQDIIDMSKNLGTSIENMSQIYQIYSNMNTSSSEIGTLAESTAILSNLTGIDASTAADEIQGVVQQFEELDSTDASHIVDVFDYISANIGVDYSKGITGIAEAVQTVGNVADQAGLSYEQLSAIIAKTMEQTRQDGSSIANGLKTIMVRLSKASSMAGDEVDTETLSNASRVLHDIGVEVYTTEGEFREFDVIMGELADKWDTLTDAQQANISYQVAATRQTAVFKSILQNWDESMQLADEASETSGNAEENNEKHLDSYAGKLQEIKNDMQEFWINFMDSKTAQLFLDFLKTLTSLLNNLQKTIKTPGIIALFTLLSTKINKSLKSGGFSLNPVDWVKNITKNPNAETTPAKKSGGLFGWFKKDSGNADTLNTEAAAEDNLTESVERRTAAEVQEAAADSASATAQAASTQNTNLNTTSENANTGSKVANAASNASDAVSENVDSAAKASNTVQTNTQTSATWALVAAKKALQLATGNVLGLITLGIGAFSLISSKIDESTMSTEEAVEVAGDYVEKMNEIKETCDDNADTISSLSDRFEELSKGISSSGENLSLSSSEYDEYIDLCAQIKEILPEIATKYNSLGDAIIYTSDAVKDLNDANMEQSFVQAEELLSAGKDEDGTTYEAVTVAYQEWEKKEKEIKGYYDKFSKYSSWGEYVDNEELTDTDASYMSDYYKAATGKEMPNIDVDDAESQEVYTAIQDYLAEQYQDVERKSSTQASNIASVMDTMARATDSVQNLYYNNNDAYNNLMSVISNLDNETISENGLDDLSKQEDFIENLVSVFKNGSKEVKNALNVLYAVPEDGIDMAAYEDQISAALQLVQNWCDENDIEITIPIGFAASEKLDEYDAFKDVVLRYVKNSFELPDYIPSSEKDYYNIYASQIEDATSRFTESQISAFEAFLDENWGEYSDFDVLWAAWEDYYQGVIDKTTWSDYVNADGRGVDIAHILNPHSTEDEDVTIADTVDDYKSEISSLGDYLDKIDSGEWTSDDATDLLNKYGIDAASVDDARNQITALMNSLTSTVVAHFQELADGDVSTEVKNSLETEILLIQNMNSEYQNLLSTFKSSGDAVVDVQNMSGAFDELDSIMADIVNGSDFDYSSIINNQDFKDNFGTLDSYNDFINAVQNNPQDLSKSQKYFNQLVSEYIYGTGALRNLNEEDAVAVANMLKQYGVTNSLEIVNSALNDTYEFQSDVIDDITNANGTLASGKKDLAINTENLDNYTWDECAALVEESRQSGYTAESLAGYTLAKAFAAGVDLTDDDNVDALIDVANAAGIASDKLIALKNAEDELLAAKKTSNPQKIKAAQAVFDAALQDAQNYYINYDPVSRHKVEVDYDGGDQTKSAIDDASSAQKDLLDAQIEELEKKYDAEQITFKNYLSARLDLIQDYYDKGLIKASDYYSELEEYYQAQLDGYDTAINAVDDAIDDEIERLNEEKQALEDANSERQAAIDLMKAQYELARSQNQRTRLVKI